MSLAFRLNVIGKSTYRREHGAVTLFLFFIIRRHDSRMRTFASLMDFSQSALFIHLFPIRNFACINISVYIIPPSVSGRPRS
jgi:hypothetical protein